jgi:phage tail-like protein
MNDQEGNPVATWDFQKAWPSKLTGPAVKSDSNEIGIEELVIVHEYIVRSQ